MLSRTCCAGSSTVSKVRPLVTSTICRRPTALQLPRLVAGRSGGGKRSERPNRSRITLYSRAKPCRPGTFREMFEIVCDHNHRGSRNCGDESLRSSR